MLCENAYFKPLAQRYECPLNFKFCGAGYGQTTVATTVHGTASTASVSPKPAPTSTEYSDKWRQTTPKPVHTTTMKATVSSATGTKPAPQTGPLTTADTSSASTDASAASPSRGDEVATPTNEPASPTQPGDTDSTSAPDQQETKDSKQKQGTQSCQIKACSTVSKNTQCRNLPAPAPYVIVLCACLCDRFGKLCRMRWLQCGFILPCSSNELLQVSCVDRTTASS